MSQNGKRLPGFPSRRTWFAGSKGSANKRRFEYEANQLDRSVDVPGGCGAGQGCPKRGPKRAALVVSCVVAEFGHFQCCPAGPGRLARRRQSGRRARRCFDWPARRIPHGTAECAARAARARARPPSRIRRNSRGRGGWQSTAGEPSGGGRGSSRIMPGCAGRFTRQSLHRRPAAILGRFVHQLRFQKTPQ